VNGFWDGRVLGCFWGGGADRLGKGEAGFGSPVRVAIRALGGISCMDRFRSGA